ncbi:MAG: ribosome biogenesis GTPase Der [Bacteroidales bacterium]|jgi:GTP-binding protein|nr:ribosome biogenesis GTPase Der [Bacteroidales bacterium]MDD4214693.1 ribosome biogenesis GTPase Der [Bacteroidales bacterium]
MANILAIVGRPNVGKSTLFNRLAGESNAIVDPKSGVTRDRHYGWSDWNGISFSVIDTGGIVVGSDDVYEEEINKQVSFAIEEADVIAFVMDAVEGLNPLDDEICRMLRKADKPIFVIANKVDTNKRIAGIAEFYKLGFDKIFPVSSINGAGTGEFLDELVKIFKPDTAEQIPDLPKIAVVGRPNAGKSSLINVFLGKERHIVTPVAGTTRDSIYTRFNAFGFDLLLVDTAGLRKKQKVTEDIEFYSTLRAIRAIENSDVCLLMIDAEKGIGAQDLHIFSIIEKNHKGVVIVVNKWDLIEKKGNTHLEFEDVIKDKIAPFTDVPVIFASALTKQRIHKTLETAIGVYKNRTQKVSTSKLNDLFLPVVSKNPPPSVKGKFPKIKYIQQLPLHYPAFAFFCSHSQYIKETYKRYLEHKIRENFNLSGVPIEIYFREK